MRIYAKGDLIVRTVQEVGAPIYARIGVREREHFPHGVSEKLSYAEAIEVGCALLAFGMSRNAGAHLPAVMADFQALMVKHTGKPVPLDKEGTQ